MQNKEFQNILKQVQSKFDRGKYDVWKNRDFEDLSFEIHKTTKTLISPATLKRIFGKVKISSAYHPQEGTLGALKQYADYVPLAEDTHGFNPQIRYGIILLLCITFVAISVSIINRNPQNNPIPIGKVSLIKLEGTCPSSALFQVERPAAKDVIHLNFGDGTDALSIEKSDMYSHFYAYPGLFMARLRSKGTDFSDTAYVFVATNGWQALTHYFEIEKRKRYHPIPIASNQKDGVFHATPKRLSALGIDTSEIAVVRIDNFKETGLNGDSFDFSTRFKNASFWPTIRCYSVELAIKCRNGEVFLKFGDEGCSTYCSYTIGEKSEHGYTQDLGFMVLDMHVWNNLQIHNSDKHVNVLLNDVAILKERYDNSLGEILGVSLQFHGSGSVDYIYLNQGDSVVFKSDF